MKATTIKLEGELLYELETIKPKTTSISAFVRELLKRNILQKRMSDAASEYRAFITANPREQAWLRDWDQADLVLPPKRKRK